MKHPLSVAGKWPRIVFAITVFLMLVMFVSYTRASPSTTFSSPVSNSPTDLIPRAWLPVVVNSYPWVKIKSGMHLGNRPSSDNTNDWNIPADYLPRLKGTAQGPWPAAIVVLSDQVYYIRRYDAACNVTNVDVKNNYVFDYLNQAAAHGTKVVFRIYPSPGNFGDALPPQQGSSHMLLPNSGDKPANYRYCDDVVRNDGKSGKAFEFFRAIDDIANEMKAIHDYNSSHGGVIASQEFFLPANEPNNEWYRAWYNQSVVPLQDNSTAWSQMDTYFSNLYDHAKSLNSAIRVLTPAMSQGLSAERVVFGTCGNNALIVNGVPTEAAGYDFMETTYRYKNDGIAWNNYWSQAKEFWSDNFCASPSNQTSHHVAQYLPTYLSDIIATSGKPNFILEADLLSPCQSPGNPIQSKDVYWSATQESIWRFIEQERASNYVVAWLLTERPHFGDACGGEPTEIAWHEAYRDNGAERPWFQPWWTRANLP